MCESVLVEETKILKEDTDQWEVFMKTPFALDFKVYVFNFENPEDILMGAKPRVKEMGPYVYKLNKWKDDVTWDHTNEEISYYEYQKYEFDQEASGALTENDMVTVLNVPYMSLLITVEETTPDFLSLVGPNLPAVFGENNGLFLKTRIKDYLFNGVRFCKNGGQDGGFPAKVICTQVKKKASTSKLMWVEENDVLFANLRFKNNSHQGYFTVKSGQRNRNDIAKLVYFENMTHVNAWIGSGSSCNQIGGVTTVFPADIDTKVNFTSFSEDICRSIKIEFGDLETVKDIKGYKFRALSTTFNNSETFPDNDCFCINKTMNLDGNYGCLFDGVLDLQTCQGGPVLASFPHYLYGDLRYVHNVEGLEPNRMKHETFVTLEPISGTPLKMAKRLQLNMFIRPILDITPLENVTHSLVPFMWVEESTTLPQQYLDVIKYSLLGNLRIINIVRWTVVAVASAIICSCIFLFLSAK